MITTVAVQPGTTVLTEGSQLLSDASLPVALGPTGGTRTVRFELSAFLDKTDTAASGDVLLVSLGLDTFEADPICRFKLAAEDYLRMGERLAGAGLPTLFLFEGGYNLDALAAITCNVLEGFAA